MRQLIVRDLSTLLILSISFYSRTETVLGQINHRSSCDPASGVAAVVGTSRVITMREIDQMIGAQLGSLEEKIFALRKAALDNLINRRLLEEEANRTGLSVDDLKQRFAALVTPIAKSQIDQVYAENSSSFSALSEDEAREKIRLDLENHARLNRYRTEIVRLRNQAQLQICLSAPSLPAFVFKETGPSLGPSDAPVTIYEYSDFQCPYCRKAKETIKQVLQLYPEKVKLVFKHLPLSIHPQAFGAGQAAYCAEEQGQFWQFHDRLFESDDLSVEQLKMMAVDLRLDKERFAACLTSDVSRNAVLSDLQEARRAGFQGTPTFVVNGRALRGAANLEEFRQAIERELQKRKNDK